MKSVKKSNDERAMHKRESDNRINERHMQEKEGKDTSSMLGNDIDAVDADIRPIYDEEPMAEERESVFVKPHHVIVSSESRNSSKNMPMFSSNDMVRNHYLEEARKNTQENGRNSRPSKCVFNANHDACVTKFLNEVNSRAKISSYKTTNRNTPVEQLSIANKLERQIPIGQRFSTKMTSTVHEKTKTPKSCLRWEPTGIIFKNVGLRWVSTRNIFTSNKTKVDSEPSNGSNEDITNPYECEQTLNVSTVNVQPTTESITATTIIHAEENNTNKQLMHSLPYEFSILSVHRFVDPDHPEKVYHLRKSLYGLKQAPRAWYDEFSNFLMSKGFTKGTIDLTLFIIRYEEDILLVKIYDSGFELISFSNVDHAGCLVTRKSTCKGIQFLDRLEYLVRRIGMRCLTPAELDVLENKAA
nr:reverse transcriptase [Tanacetum cinerariifolium]GEW52102.1 reverse transcriptase [Tanacetum cinerariifolium]